MLKREFVSEMMLIDEILEKCFQEQSDVDFSWLILFRNLANKSDEDPCAKILSAGGRT